MNSALNSCCSFMFIYSFHVQIFASTIPKCMMKEFFDWVFCFYICSCLAIRIKQIHILNKNKDDGFIFTCFVQKTGGKNDKYIFLLSIAFVNFNQFFSNRIMNKSNLRLCFEMLFVYWKRQQMLNKFEKSPKSSSRRKKIHVVYTICTFGCIKHGLVCVPFRSDSAFSLFILYIW